jgi:TPP-dependent indolepyruvate ferredoxin oxidoreductase alpha subunit
MKQLMLGNEAVARGLYEAGVKFVSSYPGTPSTEITEEVAKYEEIYAELGTLKKGTEAADEKGQFGVTISMEDIELKDVEKIQEEKKDK